MIVLSILSCGRDESLKPIITIDNAEIGAFPRLVTITTGEYDLANISSSVYMHEVEFQSENAGQNIETYNIYASFNNSNETLYKSFKQSDFGTSALGLKNIILSIPFTEISSALGVSMNSVGPGDQFNFRSEVVLDDGRIFYGEPTVQNLLY